MKTTAIGVLAVAALLSTAFLLVTTPAGADIDLPDREITVTVDRVTALDDFGSATFGELADFYGVVTVAGVPLPQTPTIDDVDDITPNWTFRTTVDRSLGSVPVSLAVFDEDGAVRGGDDEADLDSDGTRRLDLTVDVDPCAINGDATAACGTTIVSAGTADDRAEITFRIDVEDRPISADLQVEIQRVRAIDTFGTELIPEAADFYGVVSIDGVELPETPVIDDDNDITPNWQFERLVDVTATEIPIRIQVFDEDGEFRGGDDQADLVSGGDRAIDFSIDVTACTFDGDVTGACGETIVSVGTLDDRAEITFVVDAQPPPAAPDLRIVCRHTPLWPQPGDTVTVTAEVRDENLILVTADDVNIFVDDQVTPVVTTPAASTASHTFTAVEGTFFYGCEGALGDLTVFSDFRRTTVGTPGGVDRAIPILLTGEPDQRLDLVFAPDNASFTGADDPAFQAMVQDWMETELWTRDVFLVNQDLLNIWLATDTGRVGGFKEDPNRCDNDAPNGFDTVYAFAESVGVLHVGPLRDCASGRLYSSDFLPTTTHELGHTPFGLADEYCGIDAMNVDAGCVGDGAYWEADFLPNVYESESSCLADAANVGKTTCRTWTSSRNDETYFTSDQRTNDLMTDRGAIQPLDNRRISWVLNDAGRTTEGPGGAGEPATAPIPPEPSAPTTKAYRISGTVNADGTFAPVVELITTWPRYISDYNPDSSVALTSWTGDLLGAYAIPGPRSFHTYELDGTPAGHYDVDTSQLDLLVPFHPGMFQIDLVDETVALGSVSLHEAIRDFCDLQPSDGDCQEGYDLEVASLDATTDASVAVVGAPVTVDVSTVVRNNGPTDNAPGELTVSYGQSGVNGAAPIVIVDDQTIAIDDPWATQQAFEVDCTDAGTASVVLSAEIAPTSDERLETNPDNDRLQTSLDIECLLPVAINIRPGDTVNTVNAGRGTVNVAILTTEAGEYGLPAAFDASWVQPDSLLLGSYDDVLDGTGASAVRARAADMQERTDDETRDGDVDLRASFRAARTGLDVTDTEACVIGTFIRPDGTTGRFIACDAVVVNPN